MELVQLRVSHTRNLEALEFTPSPGFNVLSGDNGQGKTNILEAIYALATLRSFRTQKLAELIQLGHARARLRGDFTRGDLRHSYQLDINPRGRVARIDDKAVRPLTRYFGGVNVVLFCPEDLSTPKASPSERRRFLDRLTFGLFPSFLQTSRDYQRVLKSRNAVLKQLAEGERGPDSITGLEAQLEVYDDQLATIGAEVIARRREAIDVLRPLFRDAFEEITRTGFPVDIGYEAPEPLATCPSDELAAALKAAIVERHRLDRMRGVTSVGPHRHDLAFFLQDQPAGVHASQGQLRALILAWKTAEVALLTSHHDESPLLLLDDVSSELDPRRNEYLFEFIASKPSQCFITTTHPKHVLINKNRSDFEVIKGTLRPQSASL